jgi:ribosomal protein S12 methylthiotransferase accessory factor YcaO
VNLAESHVLALRRHTSRVSAHPIVGMTREPPPFPHLGAGGIWRATAECEPDGQFVYGLGKGRGEDTRQMSALGEAIERHHFHSSRPGKIALAQDLALAHVSPWELGVRPGLWSGTPIGQSNWSLAIDAATGEKLYVPHEGRGADRTMYRSTTSGWATHVDERAAIGALLELVERDALLRSWLGQNFGIELDGIEDPMLEGLRTIGVGVRLFCVTKEVAAPVVWAWATLPDEFPRFGRGSICSSAAAMDLVSAARSAIDGVVLKLESLPAAHFEAATEWVREPADHLLYYLSAGNRPKLERAVRSCAKEKFSALAQTFPATPNEHAERLNALVAILSRSGFRCLLINETQKYARDVGLRVTRAAVPGLVPLSFGPCSEMRTCFPGERQSDLPRRSELPPHPFA